MTALQKFLDQIILKKVGGSIYLIPAITDLQVKEALDNEKAQISECNSIYKIWCEWEMPISNGYFSTKEKAEQAIYDEDWADMTGFTAQEIKDKNLAYIIEIKIK